MSSADAPIHVRARFDGHVFVPETPVDVLEGTVVELWGEPATEGKPRRMPGSAKGLVEVRDDFDDPISDFEDYTR